MFLSAFISEDLNGAQEMEQALLRLRELGEFSVEDAALVVRQPDGSSHMWASRGLAGEGRLGGIF